MNRDDWKVINGKFYEEEVKTRWDIEGAGFAMSNVVKNLPERAELTCHYDIPTDTVIALFPVTLTKKFLDKAAEANACLRYV